ncbi:carbon-nitrogen hydrolase family protein [Rhodobacterales bacterium HKCCE2091]|nr:carbon-nitrogen hydrolase family protein [Rhodobacterales bacterium HKCCE2091]
MKLAIAQMCSADTHAANIDTLRDLAARAAGGGADMLCLPEVAGLMNADFKTAQTQVVDAADDPFLAAAREAAAAHGLWIHAGSTPVRGPGGRFLNHSALVGPGGAIVAEYDKIHLFDVTLEGRAPIGESKRFAPGRTGVVVDTPLGVLGLAICYDLRFPALARAYAKAGAEVIFYPSAFTVPTGRAHWEILLRARAIETGSWVVAAAQVGRHADGRETYGHSLVVAPWGEVALDMGGTETGLGLVDIDRAAVSRARGQVPSLEHDRPFDISRVETVDGI